MRGSGALAALRSRAAAAAAPPAVTPELVALAHELADAAGEITRKVRAAQSMRTRSARADAAALCFARAVLSHAHPGGREARRVARDRG
jgi:hypothetical protein